MDTRVMGVSCVAGGARCGRVAVAAMAVSCSLLGMARAGEVTFDGRLGTAGPVLTGPQFLIEANRGRQVGGNLFHSFQAFSLTAGDVASFRGPSDVQNILARVTGGSASSIDGTLRSEIAGANLYFVNPAGVMFGANAKLEISGSFAVTTADYLEFADGGRFDAQPGSDALLTAAPVSEFGFLSKTPAGVTINGADLKPATLRSLSVVSGDFTMNGGSLFALGGDLNIVSAAGPGAISAASPGAKNPIAKGSVSLTAGANVLSKGGGRVVIRGGRLTMAGSPAAESKIATEALGDFSGGGIDIAVGSASLSKASIASTTAAAGAAGNLTLAVAGDLMLDRGQIRGDTNGTGAGANLDVRAKNISLNDFSGIIADTRSGAGGKVEIQATEKIMLTNSSSFGATVFTSGESGGVNVFAKELDVGFGCRIGAETQGSGNGGDIFIDAERFHIRDGGIVLTNTFSGSGNAGKITIISDELKVGPRFGNVFTGISSASLTGINPEAGDGGGIHITAGSLKMKPGSDISVNTNGAGAGGRIDIRADAVTMQGPFTRITAGTTGTGDGGSIFIKAPRVTLRDGARIGASTEGGDSIGLGVRLSLEHTYVGDLGITLISPAGTRVSLVVGEGADGDDFSGTLLSDRATQLLGENNAPFAGIFKPERPLAKLSGETMNGLWRLEIEDFAAPDDGLLLGWSLLKNGQEFFSADVPRTIPDESTIQSELLVNSAGSVGHARAGAGGDITIRASESLSMSGISVIVASTKNSGPGGNISIKTGHFMLRGNSPDGFTGVYAASEPGVYFGRSTPVQGKAGDIRIEADRFDLRGGATINATTLTDGAGGTVRLDADDVSLSGKGLIQPPGTSLFENNPGIFSNSFGSAAAGSIVVNAAQIRVTEGAQISTSTSGTGRAGGIRLRAAELTLDNGASDRFTGLFAAGLPIGLALTGDGGDIHVDVQNLRIFNGAGIATSTLGSGDAGDIFVRAATGEIVGAQAYRLFSGPLGRVMFGGISASTEGGGSTGDGGSVEVRIRDLELSDGGLITARTSGLGAGGSVSVTTGRLVLSDGAYISAGTLGGGDGGNVTVKSRRTIVAGEGANISARTEQGSAGDGGTLVVSGGVLTILRGGSISAETLGSGDGGDVALNLKGHLRLDDFGFLTARTAGPGAGGSVSVDAGRLDVLDGSSISAGTGGGGSGGNVTVRSPQIGVEGDGAGISARAEEGSSGAGGTVRIEGGDLAVARGGGVSAETLGTGDGGGVSIHLTGQMSLGDHGFITAGTSSTGAGGSVEVSADRLTLSGGGAIAAGTSGSGPGGSVHVKTADIFIRSAAVGAPSIMSAESSGGSGPGGDVFIEAQRMEISGAPGAAAGVSATSSGSGDSGSVRLEVETLTLESGFVTSSNTGTGNAGSVLIRARARISLAGASVIATSSASADAGMINLASATRLDLREASSITASAGRNGGSIRITAPDFIHLVDSSITATAGTVLLAEPGATLGGIGGNIFIDPEFLVLDHATISANAAIGSGGNIFIRADNFFASESPITATGTTAGTVTIAAPQLDLSAGLFVLPEAFVDISTQLREQCAARLGMDYNSFLVIGRGGVSLVPEEPLPSAR